MAFMKNRLLYHTLRRFGEGLLWIGGGFAFGSVVLLISTLSERYLGTPIYGMAAMVVAVFMLISIWMAKHDVASEERDRERILDKLSKD